MTPTRPDPRAPEPRAPDPAPEPAIVRAGRERAEREQAGRGRGALAALVVVVALAGPLAALAGLAADPAGTGAARAPVLAVAPPWRDLDAIADAAGGRIVGPVQAPFAAFAAGGDADFTERLLTSGAWFVLDAGRLAQLCGAAA